MKNQTNHFIEKFLDGKGILAPGKKPTPDEIKELIADIEHRISIKQINMRKNFHLKEGLTDCLRILNDRLEHPENNWKLPETEDEIEPMNQIYRNQLKELKN